MRSLKNLNLNWGKYRLGGKTLRIGKWYRVMLINRNTYIFKFSGVEDNYVARDYSYSISHDTYNDKSIRYLCRTSEIYKVYDISSDDVLKYFKDY